MTKRALLGVMTTFLLLMGLLMVFIVDWRKPEDVLVIGALLSFALLIYMNMVLVFENYVVMLYFDYPDFIR